MPTNRAVRETSSEQEVDERHGKAGPTVANKVGSRGRLAGYLSGPLLEPHPFCWQLNPLSKAPMLPRPFVQTDHLLEPVYGSVSEP